jgi:hypothetical protein
MTVHAAEILMDVSYKPYLWSDVRQFRNATWANTSLPVTFDVCALFKYVCDRVMADVGCPQAAVVNEACSVGATSAVGFIGRCGCGGPDTAITRVASTRTLEYIIDGVTAEALARKWTYTVPSRSPGSHLVGSSNFKQLISPAVPLPGYTTSFG